VVKVEDGFGEGRIRSNWAFCTRLRPKIKRIGSSYYFYGESEFRKRQKKKLSASFELIFLENRKNFKSLLKRITHFEILLFIIGIIQRH